MSWAALLFRQMTVVKRIEKYPHQMGVFLCPESTVNQQRHCVVQLSLGKQLVRLYGVHTLHIYRDDSDNAGLNYWHVKDRPNYETLLLTT